MKKRYLILSLILILVFALAISACDGKTGTGSEHSVTFDYNYEGAAVTVLKTKDGAVRFVDDPERENYVFEGWYLEPECKTPFTALSVDRDITVYAKWKKIEDSGEPSECAVSFSINGGNGTLPQNTSVASGSYYTLPSGDGLTRDGYIFDGWKSGDSVYAAGDKVKIQEDTVFFAVWAPATTVSFSVNGGAGTAPQDITVKSGSQISLPSGDGISKPGYTFDGWLNGGTLCSDPFTVPADAEITLYAAWAGEYTLTLVCGEKTEDIKVMTGVGIQLTAGDEVAGKRFTGWINASTGILYEAGSEFVCGYNDVTLTAQYEDTLAVTYCDWDGTVLKTVSYIEGEEIVAPNLFITAYAEFAGWDTDLSAITESATVTAQYDYTFTDMRYFNLDFSGSFSARYDGYFLRFSELSDALSPLTEVAFPITWKGSPVIGVYSSGSAPINSEFYRYVTLESVYIPSSFKLLPTYAFYDCTSLKDVKFSKTPNLTQIGTSAFRGCTALKTFTLPKSVTTLSTTPYGDSYTVENVGSGYQFQGCTSLEEFIFEEGSPLTKVAGYMFADCSALTKVTNIPSVITVLPFSMFRNCTALKTFTVPAKVTILGGWVFDGCRALGEIVFAGDSVNKIGEYALYNTALTELNIPAKVTFIPHNMAYGCKQLVKVTTGENVVTIDYEAFGGCPSLAYFNSEENGLFVMPKSLRNLNAGAFMYAASMKRVELNDGLEVIGDGAFAAYYRYSDKTNESVGLTEITIPASVTSLGEGLFEADIYLTNITILSTKTDFETYEGIMYRKSTRTLAYCPIAKVAETLSIREGTVGVEDFAFANTSAVNKVICPSSLKEIGTGAFQLSVISEVEFNEGLYLIGEASFYLLEKLTSVIIPASVEVIENHAFFMCSELSSVTFAKGSRLTTLGREVFSSTDIATVEIPAAVTQMGIGVFQNCKKLKTVTFGEGSEIEYIAQNTFNSSGLESIALPESVKELHYNSLSYNNLTQIDLKNVVSIGQQVFTSTKLVSVYIPATVTEMGVHAFSQISTLKSVTFAEDSALAIISNYAFYGDTGIKELTLPASVTNINMAAFAGVELNKLTLNSPMVVSLYDNAFGTDAVNVIKQLCVPALLVNNYKNNEVWSRVCEEIVAIQA